MVYEKQFNIKIWCFDPHLLAEWVRIKTSKFKLYCVRSILSNKLICFHCCFIRQYFSHMWGHIHVDAGGNWKFVLGPPDRHPGHWHEVRVIFMCLIKDRPETTPCMVLSRDLGHVGTWNLRMNPSLYIYNETNSHNLPCVTKVGSNKLVNFHSLYCGKSNWRN